MADTAEEVGMEGDITEEDIVVDITGDFMAVIGEVPFTTEHQDSEADSFGVTGRMDITIPIQTTVCAKDGFQLASITPKTDRTPIPAFGMRFRSRMGIGKLSPAISPVLL